MKTQPIQNASRASANSRALAASGEETEAALRGFLANELWPGRASLHVRDAARALQVTELHVRNLILIGRLKAINLGNVKTRTGANRGVWRIPASAWDAFVRENAAGEGETK